MRTLNTQQQKETNSIQELLDEEYHLLDYEESDSSGNNSKEKENNSCCYYSDSPAESLQDGIQIGDLDQEQQLLEKMGQVSFNAMGKKWQLKMNY